MPRPQEVGTPTFDEPFDEPGPKRRRSQGPRKEKPIYLLFRVTDDQDNPVPNARLQIVLATKDTDQVLELQSEDKSLSLTKIELPKYAAE